MRAGNLDRLITIQSKTETQAASGEPVESWSNVVDRKPASMRPVKGDERFVDPQRVAEEQVEFRVRYSSVLADLSPLDRVIYPCLTDEELAVSPLAEPSERRIHDILAVHEIGRREGLQIITSRRVDVPA